MSYSIDVLKKSSFQHEFTNILNIVPLSKRDENWKAVEEYFRTRIEELDKATRV